MNNQGKTLTSMVIALLAFIAVLSLTIVANNNFISTPTLSPHAQNDSGIYNSSYNDLTNSSSLQSQILNPLSPRTNFLADVFKSGITIITTAIIGLKALSVFLQLPGIINSMFENIAATLPLGGASGAVTPLLWFFTTAFTFYVVMQFIKAVRGTYETP